MSIWVTKPTPSMLNETLRMTMANHLGIEFLDIGNDYIKAKMPVDRHTIQPQGMLHGGASAAFAETLGSVAGNLCVDRSKKICVGLDINANFIRRVKGGFVYGVVSPLHLGASTQVWEIRIQNEGGELICVSRVTLAVLDKETFNR